MPTIELMIELPLLIYNLQYSIEYRVILHIKVILFLNPSFPSTATWWKSAHAAVLVRIDFHQVLILFPHSTLSTIVSYANISLFPWSYLVSTHGETHVIKCKVLNFSLSLCIIIFCSCVPHTLSTKLTVTLAKLSVPFHCVDFSLQM